MCLSEPRSNPYNIFLFIAIILSFAMNIYAMVLILLKLRFHQGSLCLGPSPKRTRAQEIMVILADSGLIYSAFQLIFVSMAYIPFTRLSAMNTLYSILFPVYFVFTGIYPSVIVVLVGQDLSLVETFGFRGCKSQAVDLENCAARPATAGHLSFASFPTEGTAISESRVVCGEGSEEMVGSDEQKVDGRHAETCHF
ncbi:hypothetical protein FPV67DRAFT_162200 [Lyophyllum atratum]|nr:hypothetical protein FPV67DRAFT_162200 [Lyophyllum atratum]